MTHRPAQVAAAYRHVAKATAPATARRRRSPRPASAGGVHDQAAPLMAGVLGTIILIVFSIFLVVVVVKKLSWFLW